METIFASLQGPDNQDADIVLRQASQILNAGGLVIAGDANLVFAAGATLTVANASQIRHKGTVGMPLVTCAGTGTVTGRPTIVMEEDGWKLDETNGNLNIHRPIGFMLIVQ
jgi:hypothetical protein